jgi:hypothetical protein
MSPLASRGRLAVLGRQQGREGVHFVVDQGDDFHQHTRTALRIPRRPLFLRFGGVGHGRLDLGGRRQRHVRLDLAGVRVEDVAEPARRTRDVLAADEMR